jgi:stearoyl-CoA desaturase (delta-9 desaturase)
MNPWLQTFLVAFGITQVAVLAETMYLHRGLAHRGVTYRKPAEFLLRLVLWITTGIDRRDWVAVHRKHHAHTDVEGDPHSPKLAGFWSIQLLNSVHYWRAVKDRASVMSYSRDIQDDWLDRQLFGRRWLLGLAIGVGLLAWLLGPLHGIIAGFAHFGLFMFLNATINGLGHTAGYRNFENTATNNQHVALVTCGEALHNNHHAFPSCPKLSMRSREIDPSWPFIKLLQLLGQASPRPTVSLKKLGHAKGQPLPMKIGEQPVLAPMPVPADDLRQ